MRLLHFKKGQAANYIAVVVFLLVMGFLVILATAVHNAFITAYTNTGFFTGAVADAGADFTAALLLYDDIMVLVMVVLIIGVGLTSFKLRTSPAFFIVTLIESAFTGYVSYFFNFVFTQMVSESTLNAVLLSFPKTMLICTNLHWVALITIVVGSITLYAKKEKEGGTFVE